MRAGALGALVGLVGRRVVLPRPPLLPEPVLVFRRSRSMVSVSAAVVLRPVGSATGLCCLCWLDCSLASRGRLPLCTGRGRQGFVESRSALRWDGRIATITSLA